MAPKLLRGATVIALATLIGVSLAFSLPRESIGSLGVFVGAGRLAALGQNPYGIADITPQGPSGIQFPNLSPPVTVIIFQQIAWDDLALLFRIWYGAGLVLYSVVLLAFSRGYSGGQLTIRVLWALGIFPLWFTLGIGQVQVALLVLVSIAWLALPAKRDVLAGIALGLLIAWKPNLILWPVLLFLIGRRRPSLIAFAVAGILSVWPVFVYGPLIYREWIEATIQTTNGIGGYGLLSFLANDAGLPWLGSLLSAILIVGTVVWAWRAQPSAQRAGEVALVVSLLALPLTNAAYLLLVVPIILGRRWTAPTILAAILLLVPWQLFLNSRIPWPYAVVLVLLLNVPLVSTRFAEVAAALSRLRPLRRRYSSVA